MGQVIGLDLAAAARRLIETGTHPDIAEDLLAACELGFVGAMNEREDKGEG